MHVRLTDSGNYELRIRNRLLPKDVYFTFSSEEKANDYGRQVEELLAAGVVPKELVPEKKPDGALGSVIRAWLAHGEHSKHDGEVLDVLLREAYMLRKEQVGEKALRVQCSKQWHGREAWRDVPMVKEIRAMMVARAARTPAKGLIFPWWDGDPDELERVTTRLSRRFGTAFAYAMCDGLTEHDLRHEATCRWFEMKDKKGNWIFREAEIGKIMGWAPGSPMAKRYASFRAEDLASRLG